MSRWSWHDRNDGNLEHVDWDAVLVQLQLLAGGSVDCDLARDFDGFVVHLLQLSSILGLELRRVHLLEGLGAMEEVGSIYVFRRSDEVRDGAGVLLRTPKWAPKEVLKMQYPQKQRQSHFGAALDLDGSDLIVGAPGISTSPILPQSGRAFAYDLSVAGVKFTNPWFSCVEGNADGLVGLTLSRPVTTSNLTRPLTIGYATEDRSAVGVDALKFAACMKVPSTQRKDCGDYQQAAGEVTFAAGEMSKLVTIPIMEDNCLEQWEKHFVVRLHVPGGEPLLGEDFIARVRIDDDDFNSDPC